MLEKGFILTSNYFDSQEGIEIILEGVSTSGPFRIVLNQEKAVFFVEEKSQANSNLAIEKITSIKKCQWRINEWTLL